MNAKHLILAVVVTVWASAAIAAIKYGHPEPLNTVSVETTAIPRVVVTARKAEAEVPRILVVGRRSEVDRVLASR